MRNVSWPSTETAKLLTFLKTVESRTIRHTTGCQTRGVPTRYPWIASPDLGKPQMILRKSTSLDMVCTRKHVFLINKHIFAHSQTVHQDVHGTMLPGICKPGVTCQRILLCSR